MARRAFRCAVQNSERSVVEQLVQYEVTKVLADHAVGFALFLELKSRDSDAELVARFQLEFLLSLTVKVNAVLCGGKFLDDNLATLDDKLNVLTGN